MDENTCKIKKVKCKVYPTFTHGKFIFPEIEDGNVNPNNLAVCVSGGGSRSYAAAIGLFRGLVEQDLLRKICYISTVSGGSWFLSILMFAKNSLDELLGESVYDIDEKSLREKNFDNPFFMGNCIIDFPFMNLLSDGMRRGIPKSKCYQYVLANIFLRRYHLEDKIPVLNDTSVYLNEKYNSLKCIAPRENSPFLLFQAALIDCANKESSPFEYTQMYSGSRVPKKNHGGKYFQNQGLGCFKTEVKENKLNILKVKERNGDSCLESFIAGSSAAYTPIAMENAGNFLGQFVEPLSPELNLWTNSSNNNIVNIGDGAFVDNTGIIGCLARGCKKILAFITSNGIEDNPANLSMAHLFGVEDRYRGIGWEYRRKFQVFRTEEWYDFRKQINKKVKKQELVYYRKKFQVLENWDAGVNGGYEVDLLVVYVEKVPQFDKYLTKLNELQLQDLGNYPNYDLFFSARDSILGLTPTQVNIISTYSHWYMINILRRECDFLNEAISNSRFEI